MLAFDHKCWRLGYGGGFYDRTIAGMRKAGHAVTAIGIAYDGQRVDRVPVGPFDVALDAVLTPGGLHHPDFDSADSGEV
jgi:5-formyltetrahydrofolate cyclo-ligase